MRRRPRGLLAAVAAGALGGLLLSLANPPADLGPVAFGALIPLLWALRGARVREGAAAGLVFGLVFYGLLLGWLRLYGVIAWLPLVVSQAAYAGLFGAIAPLLWRRGHPWRWALGLAALWTAVDWVRGDWPIGGFTWGGLGYTQHGDGFLLPLATVTGVWGVTFVVVLVNALLLETGSRLATRTGHGLEERRGRGWPRPLAAGLLPVVAAGTVLLPALIPPPAAAGPRLDVAVVQGNVPRSLASDRQLQSRAVAESVIALHRKLASRQPDLAVWPENALDTDPSVDPILGPEVSAAVRAVGAPTVAGALAEDGRGRFYNQALFYSGRGSVVGRYTKMHLVPFGEYIPFQSVLGWTNRYRLGNLLLSPGHSIRLFDVSGVPVATPICFENVFPDLFRRFVAAGARLVVVTTNDSSFFLSPASREHVIMSQLRAVETGRWIVQAAISGESAFVDPRGVVVKRSGLFQRTILRLSVPTSTARTPYVRFGDWFPWACGLVVLVGLAAMGLVGRRGSGKRSVATPPAGEGEASSRRLLPAPIAGAAEPRVLVVLPTFNERQTIATVLAKVIASGENVEALVVDDNSPDGTGEVVAGMAERDPRVRLMRRSGKLGLASAYLAGFHRGLEDGYDVIVEMDADLSHRPEDLAALIEGAARYDLTIGSRYVPGGEVSNWSRARVALSRAGNAYARIALRLPVNDATSGYRAYRRAALERLVSDGIRSDGYAFQIELAYRAWQDGFTIGEVPITFREREHGRSKLSRRIVAEALLKVGEWGLRDRLRRDGRPSAR